ncbi:site-specific integrase [Leifsonia sp. TF02-11]|uniref:site-specific integrase n=1 Tax=Leifsonia sp. TF02-11 TaxID=2815212 RepID=UPI001AA1B038|nr:site-specific integrase [Leifsonia sp. TF02-11]MBO1739795.1 site-specific integrase [Leifsonia sp. TF02-11]
MDEQGRAVQVSGTGSTEEEAIKRREENYKKRLVKMGELPISALNTRPIELKKTTGELLWEWHAYKKAATDPKNRVTTQVAAQYANLIRLHIEPALGRIPIRLLQSEDIRNFLFVTLPAKKKVKTYPNGERVETKEPLVGESHKRAIQGVLNMACRYAVEAKYISENPTANIPLPSKPKSKAKKEQLEKKRWIAQRLAKNLEGNPDECRWMFTFLLGIRQSERLGLTWDCFSNLDKNGATATVEIRQQLMRDPESGKLYIKGETKTEAGERLIPLDARLLQVIKAYRKIQREWKKSPNWSPDKGLENLVFTMPNGKPIRHTTDNKQWHKLLEDNRIPYIRQHAMRHIAISTMIIQGFPIEIVRAIAGHETEAITRTVYTHIDVKSKVEPMRGLTDEIFKERER